MIEAYKGYINLKYEPDKSDLICSFKIKPAKGRNIKEAASAVAAESSIGTWTEVATSSPRIKKMGAKVFDISGNKVKIAYPIDLFEKGNVPQILSSIAGNIFGMKEVDALRLEDVHWPEEMIRSFRGPLKGVLGVRQTVNIFNRPLCGTIIKPKLGLREKEHAKVAYQAWSGGIDIVKDDENLSSMTFNNFEKRIKETLKLKEKAERETGENKVYLPNITAETKEMIKRAEKVYEEGGQFVMVDILTVGWSALQTLREETQDLKLALHAHRAMHGALTRNKDHGISMMVIADISRLIGMDLLHIGTGIGKMEGESDEIAAIVREIQSGYVAESKHQLHDVWRYTKPVFAVCSGGLHPGHVPFLFKRYGKDIVIQAGGGVHGHPNGTKAGAKALRQAIDAAVNDISLREYAKSHKELFWALKKWQG